MTHLRIRLKPGTPWRIRRLIRKKEADRDRLETWLIRCCYLLGAIVIVTEVICLAGYY